MIRRAQEKDTDEIREVFAAGFSDPEGWTNLFFKHRYDIKHEIVYELDNRVVSIASVFPCRLMSGGVWHEMLYLYAGATLHEYRSRGIYGAILDHAFKEIVTKGGGGIILVPGEPSLYEYYERLGYTETFNMARHTFSAAEIASLNAEPYQTLGPNISRIGEIRNCNFACDGFVAWGMDNLSFAVKTAEYSGAGAMILEGEGYAICSRNGDTIEIIESVAEDDERLLKTVMQVYPAEKYILRQPVWLSRSVKPFAVARLAPHIGFDANKAYFNLAMSE